jgi:hypothetical protein
VATIATIYSTLNAHRRFFPDLLLLPHENTVSARGKSKLITQDFIDYAGKSF